MIAQDVQIVISNMTDIGMLQFCRSCREHNVLTDCAAVVLSQTKLHARLVQHEHVETWVRSCVC